MTAVPPPLAEHARNALSAGSCSRCRYGVRPGQRVARLPDGTWAHAWCAASTVPPRPPQRKARR